MTFSEFGPAKLTLSFLHIPVCLFFCLWYIEANTHEQIGWQINKCGITSYLIIDRMQIKNKTKFSNLETYNKHFRMLSKNTLQWEKNDPRLIWRCFFRNLVKNRGLLKPPPFCIILKKFLTYNFKNIWNVSQCLMIKKLSHVTSAFVFSFYLWLRLLKNVDLWCVHCHLLPQNLFLTFDANANVTCEQGLCQYNYNNPVTRVVIWIFLTKRIPVK